MAQVSAHGVHCALSECILDLSLCSFLTPLCMPMCINSATRNG
jgi:hypothetical protein